MDQRKEQPLSVLQVACFIAIAVSAMNFYLHPTHRPVVIGYRIALIGLGAIGLILSRFSSGLNRSVQRKAAERILRMQKDVYGGVHEYREASLDEFPHLDRTFYESMRQWAQTNGFRFLGDRENVT